jgi:hypothetical protein
MKKKQRKLLMFVIILITLSIMLILYLYSSHNKILGEIINNFTINNFTINKEIPETIVPYICYQESFNIVNQRNTDGNCELKYNGNLVTEGLWKNIDNGFNGDFSDSYAAAPSSSIPVNLYINYTKPKNSIAASWRIGAYSSIYEENKTIPSRCWDASATTLAFKNTQLNFNINHFFCLDTKGEWFELWDAYNPGLYEEGMFWTINKI